jgi:hypothetical protein
MPVNLSMSHRRASFDQRQFGTASKWGKVLACFEPMEDAMSQADEREPAASAPTAVHRFLSRLRDWWRRHSELDTMDPEELERIAKDLGMTGPELKDLAARGPDAAHLLHERMHVLGLTKVDVERVAQGLMRDMERTCACCGEKGVCEKDLAAQPDDPSWGGYCPNAVALTAVKIAKSRFPA